MPVFPRRFASPILLSAFLLAPLVSPATAQGLAGNYLAARHATIFYDFDKLAEHAGRALALDRENPALLESTMQAYVSIGRVDRAVKLALRMQELTDAGQLSGMVIFADLAKQGDWDGIIADLDAGVTVGPLFDGLIRGWAQVGLGDLEGAQKTFETVSTETGLQAFGEYHRALAMAVTGDLAGAAAIFDGGEAGRVSLTRNGNITYFQILSQLDRQDDAVARLDEVFGPTADPALTTLRDSLLAGQKVPVATMTSVADGVAEVFFSIAGALNGEADHAYTLLYSRLASHLSPAHIEALLMSANKLEQLKQYDPATEVYRAVPRNSSVFYAAELGRAEALRLSGDPEAAVEVISALASEFPDLSLIHITLGDTLRRMGEYQRSSEAYDRAIALLGPENPNHWLVYFARGITHERTDRWVQAEDDMRRALRLSPDQPSVLNYLGYTMVERQENLDEALDMIQKAAAAEPDSGHIIDSLGWVLYRLGRYDEAVEPMERASQLMAVDPVVNDHLGDVYWAVGRKLEAEFQWKRALSFVDPEDADSEADPDRIRRKLEVGLDVVLAEEGAAPLTVADDG
ncbi:MAG: tetratricopeptide repeat protein [Rhodobacteraceae bacterium]|nr:tetratricopeptide repeat protein [Paracoccaceae bacterium]